MFSITFTGSGEIFHGFFYSFSGLHKLETKGGGKSRKNHWTRKFDAGHFTYDYHVPKLIQNPTLSTETAEKLFCTFYEKFLISTLA